MNGDSSRRNEERRLLANLRPNGAWRLSETMRSVLRRQISDLPKREVSEEGARCPKDGAGMNAFLRMFFTRHFFQIQNSLAKHVTSAEFPMSPDMGQLRVLDVGAGPAVASLAITDMLSRLSTNRRATHTSSLFRRRAITHVLNDPSAICLATGKHMLSRYNANSGSALVSMPDGPVITIQKGFPDNLHTIQRLAHVFGGFDIVILSYVVRVLAEAGRFVDMVRGIEQLERLCSAHGRIVIVQDKFRHALLGRLARRLKTPWCKQTLTQEVYPQRGENKEHTYTYYDCVYPPSRKGCVRTA